MEIIVKYCYVCFFVQKVCFVVDLICGKKVLQVLDILIYINKKVVVLVKKVLEFVIVNVEYNDGVDIDDLKVMKIFVDEGLSMKCIMLCVKGCVDCILKCISYIIVVVFDC